MLQSKLMRQYFVTLPIWLGMEYLISYLLVSFFGDDGDIAFSALILVGALYVFRIVNAGINFCLSIPMYYYTKKQRVDATVALLYANKIPVTDEMISKDGAIEVFQSLVNSKQTSIEVKIFASTTLGELAGIRSANNTTLFMQTQFIIDAAIARYISERNASKPNLD